MMIDEQGYRANVGIVLINKNDLVFWGKRTASQNAWQFPQGGLQENETPEEAVYRELQEEVGLNVSDVSLLANTQEWLHYDLPKYYQRRHQIPLCIGQKQKWFLFRLISHDHAINLNVFSSPEFDAWQWVSYWYPLEYVIEFKRPVYEKVLTEFEKNLRSEAN